MAVSDADRVISGLSMAVVIVEAGAHSGALLTAGIAAEQGRDVMAVPGNVDRPGSRGTNGLIRDGAILVEDASDVLSALESSPLRPWPLNRSHGSLLYKFHPNSGYYWKNLSLTPKHIDALAVDVKQDSRECRGPIDYAGALWSGSPPPRQFLHTSPLKRQPLPERPDLMAQPLCLDTDRVTSRRFGSALRLLFQLTTFHQAFR